VYHVPEVVPQFRMHHILDNTDLNHLAQKLAVIDNLEDMYEFARMRDGILYWITSNVIKVLLDKTLYQYDTILEEKVYTLPSGICNMISVC
jgi:hypothetical protein